VPVISEVTTAAVAAFPVDRSYELITRLAALDRFQGSRGIEVAADLVAEHAERAGLTGVEIRRFPADARARWWSFRAPRAWTPLSGTLDLLTPSGPARMVSFPELPCALATNSAPAELAAAPLIADLTAADLREAKLAGAVVVLPKGGRALRPVICDLESAGAAGLITDAASPAGTAAGRIELSRDTRLFGFSVPSPVMETLLAAARRGERVRVRVRVDDDALMPLVHGLLPGRAEAPEILLQAHLCHPRPAANDNASGVAAAIGVAATLGAIGGRFGEPRKAVRFLWAPEFAGTAAYLHDRVGQVPELAINLDMVGGRDVPLVIESPPGNLPSLLPGLAEEILASLPTPLRSYSGAIPLRDWQWEVAPFAGGSDHAVLAGVGCPAVGLGYWPDPYRHTSLDTPDRIGLEELRRAGALTAAMIQFVRSAHAGDIPRAQALIARAAYRRMLTIMGRAAAGGDDEAGRGSAGRVDPFASPWLYGFLAHQASAAHDAMRQTSLLLGGDGTVGAGLTALPDPRNQANGQLRRWPGREAPAREIVRREWKGPFNLQGLEDAASPADRRWLIEHEDAYSRFVGLAIALDDVSPLTEVVAQAAYSTWLPIDMDFARRFVRVLVATGWADADRHPGSLQADW
jgi:hypothetical protein